MRPPKPQKLFVENAHEAGQILPQLNNGESITFVGPEMIRRSRKDIARLVKLEKNTPIDNKEIIYNSDFLKNPQSAIKAVQSGNKLYVYHQGSHYRLEAILPELTQNSQDTKKLELMKGLSPQEVKGKLEMVDDLSAENNELHKKLEAQQAEIKQMREKLANALEEIKALKTPKPTDQPQTTIVDELDEADDSFELDDDLVEIIENAQTVEPSYFQIHKKEMIKALKSNNGFRINTPEGTVLILPYHHNLSERVTSTVSVNTLNEIMSTSSSTPVANELLKVIDGNSVITIQHYNKFIAILCHDIEID